MKTRSGWLGATLNIGNETIYCARPGMRIWRSNLNGKVDNHSLYQYIQESSQTTLQDTQFQNDLPPGCRHPPAERNFRRSRRLGGRHFLLQAASRSRPRPLTLVLGGNVVPRRSRRSEGEYRHAVGGEQRWSYNPRRLRGWQASFLLSSNLTHLIPRSQTF